MQLDLFSKHKANLVTRVKFALNNSVILKNYRINHTWNDWQHENQSIVLETNPSIYISLDRAIYLAQKELKKKVGRTAVTGWVRENSLGMKVGDKYHGQWLVRSDLFKQHLTQKKGRGTQRF
jgi:hypothetical protein